tara:strand:- start:99 stop:449 length:351 start_codon:yes stop_codon:yes gene_type:complete
MVIILNNKITNDSFQIGDIAYFVSVNPSNNGIISSQSDPQILGKIDAISSDLKQITINNPQNVNQISQNDFLMFQKDTSVNNTSLLGYFAEVKLINNSTEKAELFALSSEIGLSSK